MTLLIVISPRAPDGQQKLKHFYSKQNYDFLDITDTVNIADRRTGRSIFYFINSNKIFYISRNFCVGDISGVHFPQFYCGVELTRSVTSLRDVRIDSLIRPRIPFP